jgi:dethiobiotin synthetase
MKRWFITGTDTEIGKTHVACAWIRHLVGQGHAVAAMKPVASGCVMTADGLRNEDALAMMAETNVTLDYEQVNPYAFEPAIAPHIAAQEAGVSIEIPLIATIAGSIKADHLVIEGAGGGCVPLHGKTLFPELVRVLNAEVIIVVGMRLGCINHGILTAREILRVGQPCAGWVANAIDPDMTRYRNNLKSLSKLMPVPLLAELGFGKNTIRLLPGNRAI